MSLNSPKVLITGDLNMLRCFPSSRIPTLSLLDGSNEEMRRSRHCREWTRVPDSAVDPDGFVNALIALAPAHRGGDADGRPILCYGIDHVMLTVSRHRERLARHFRFLMPSEAMMEACTDKNRFVDLARKHALPVPRSLVISDLHDLDGLRDRAFYPCIVKPDFHVATVPGIAGKVLRADNWEDLSAALALLARYARSVVLQERIEGGEEQIHSYHAYVNAEGKILAEHLGKKIRTWPSFAGFSTYLELIRNDELRALGRDVVTRLGIAGPVKIDFKQDIHNGRFYLLEYNLRFNMWNYLGARAGVNLPMAAYRDLCGLPPESPARSKAQYRTDLAWLSFGDDMRSFLRCYRREGKLTTWGWLKSYLRPKVYSKFAWTDPWPVIHYGFGYGVAALRNRLIGKPRKIPGAKSSLS
jgi:predicted ATP-grasp superfamily ATP-dependent carboligase